MGTANRTNTLIAALAAVGISLLCFSATASAKEVVDYFGTPPGPGGGGFATGTAGGSFRFSQGIAVNDSGAAPAEAGDIYVADGGNNRIQRFGHDDKGTPDPTDDTYFFISAWGADVVSPGGSGDLGDESDAAYEICTVASECKAAVASAGNATATGNGSLDRPTGLALDQDTGDLYVSDAYNRRIAVYDGAGSFLRAFGFDVIAPGSPGDTGTGFEICVAADGDVCKKGLTGSGAGQIGTPEGGMAGIAVSTPDGNPATGTVYFADALNHRVNTYGLDGSSPSSFGSAVFSDAGGGWRHPTRVAVDSRGIVYASNLVSSRPGTIHSSHIERYDTENANGQGVGFLDPLTGPIHEGQTLVVTATGGEFKLTFQGETTVSLPHDAPAISIRDALRTLPSIGNSNVAVSGGPGNGFNGPEDTYHISFVGALAATDVDQIVASDGDVPLSGGSATVTTVIDGDPGGPLVLGETGQGTADLYVDPTSDTLYALRNGRMGQTSIQQFGPLNDPGLTAPPVAADDEHGAASNFSGQAEGLALDQATGRIYVTSFSGGDQQASGVYVLGEAGPPPTASLDSIGDITSTSAIANATIDPNGPPVLSYRLEYSTDGSQWTSTPTTVLGTQTEPQSLGIPIDPPAGLAPKTLYHVRVIAKRLLSPAIVTSELTFTTLGEKPSVETVGAPVRATSTAVLNGRVNPRNSATTYHFEYGSVGPCDANPCASTSVRSAGAGDEIKLLSESVSGLEADTTYHYRLIADNGEAGSPSFGEDMTLTTRASDAPLTHGDFPGPSGSDRAYEQVSVPDSGGNPVSGTDEPFVSLDGNRATYELLGGAPITNIGTSFDNVLLSERPPGDHPSTGWETRRITPDRSALPESPQVFLEATPDLSHLLAVIKGQYTPGFAAWGMAGANTPSLLFDSTTEQALGSSLQTISADGSRRLVGFQGGVPDPAYPGAGAVLNIYDVSSGAAELASILPDGTPACLGSGQDSQMPGSSQVPWVSPDGSLLYFTSEGSPSDCGDPVGIFVRDLDSGVSTAVSGGPISGPDCDSYLLRTTAEAVFFYTESRLDPQDAAVGGCHGGSGGDIYRYELDSGARECVSCTGPGLSAHVARVSDAGQAIQRIGVSSDGSKAYFHSAAHLLAGSPPAGQLAIYRLDVDSGALDFVAALEGIEEATLGQARQFNPTLYALSADGTTLIFTSASSHLNPLGGADNGGTEQYYRYDHRDRSLVCVSCPPDGSAPTAGVVGTAQPPISADGRTIAFATPTALIGADQNTPQAGLNPQIGTDVYEWRDGRLLLVTDGITSWPYHEPAQVAGAPTAAGVSPSGRDVYFTAAARYTPDAIDGFRRLYDARIGGGIDFPEAEPPCPLEVCQGTPRGAPEPLLFESRNAGPGNLAPEPQSCTAPARRAKRLARQARRYAVRAKGMGRAAARSASPAPAREMRRRARRLGMQAKRRAVAAKRLRTRAKRCRAANRAGRPDR